MDLQPHSYVTIRHATSHDGLTVERLAALDSQSTPHGEVLLAEREGVALAAISLISGRVVADLCERTETVVWMLRRRRYELLRQGGEVAPARMLLRRVTQTT